MVDFLMQETMELTLQKGNTYISLIATMLLSLIFTKKW